MGGVAWRRSMRRLGADVVTRLGERLHDSPSHHPITADRASSSVHSANLSPQSGEVLDQGGSLARPRMSTPVSTSGSTRRIAGSDPQQQDADQRADSGRHPRHRQAASARQHAARHHIRDRGAPRRAPAGCRSSTDWPGRPARSRCSRSTAGRGPGLTLELASKATVSASPSRRSRGCRPKTGSRNQLRLKQRLQGGA
jgi:hypothetical protein